MDIIRVNIGQDSIPISRDTFLSLLDFTPVKRRVAYKRATEDGELSMPQLKDLAQSASVPFPLFFAPPRHVQTQLDEFRKNLYQKMPPKDEILLSARGTANIQDISLIVKDLSRKQEFLKKRVLTSTGDNHFIGVIARDKKVHADRNAVAENVRTQMGIDLEKIRGMSKTKVFEYLCGCAESHNILVSVSSHNFMPQNISRDTEFSGFCVRDKKFPYIFINTKDGDPNPKIIEPEGRKIFTFCSMLVCIGLNKFFLSTMKGKWAKDEMQYIYSVAGRILVTKEDLVGLTVSNIEDVRNHANTFKVTPSMMATRLKEERKISSEDLKKYLDILRNVPKSPGHPNQPHPETGYGKYNGNRFSQETVAAFQAKRISAFEFNGVLFRRGKITSDLTAAYLRKYGN